ncbi:MAG: Imm70 family immunity protein [Pseudomonas sp.]|uniref:Imm70 family immunity protein n=1 Tax=Pseudomonas sp. TaxID=306 RepID=UPI00339A777A
MAVGITVGSITDEIGAPSFVHAFFSTISAHCEPNGWGTSFPGLMKELYQGRLSFMHSKAALGELEQAKLLLKDLQPSQVVWDIEDRKTQPPWGNNIASTITNLSNYFVSSTGGDVFALLEAALRASADKGRDVTLG